MDKPGCWGSSVTFKGAFKENISNWPEINKHQKKTNKQLSEQESPKDLTEISSGTSLLSQKVKSLHILPEISSYNESGDTRTRQEILLERKLRKAAQKNEREKQNFKKLLAEIRAPKGTKVNVIDRKTADKILNPSTSAINQSNEFTKGHRSHKSSRSKQVNLAEFLDHNLNASTQLPIHYEKSDDRNQRKNLVEFQQPKGKTREVPKQKRLSRLKKNVLLSREARKENGASQEIQEQNEAEIFLNELLIKCAENEVLEAEPSRSESGMSEFSRKFRPYCNNIITKELCEATENLLRDVFRFQDRAYNKNQIKARAHKRFVVGFKEVQRQLEIGNIKLIIIAPDLEPTSTEDLEGGIDYLVKTLKEKCDQDGIPYVFSIRRWVLGRILFKKVPVSCVGLISMEGSESNSLKLFELIQEGRKLFINN